MARTFTIQELEDRVRLLTETENDDNVTEPFVRSQLSTLYGQLWGAVVETGMRYFETRDDLLTDGTNELDAPADLFALVRLDYRDASGRLHPVRELMAQELDRVTSPQRVGQAEYFEHVGALLLLYGLPPTGQTYQIIYVPQPPDLVALADADPVDVVTVDGEAFLTYAAAAIVQAKRDRDPRFWAEQGDRAFSRLVNFARLRALHQPRRNVVRDEYGDDTPREGDFR